jgi:ABC-2 type transport system permease protein
MIMPIRTFNRQFFRGIAVVTEKNIRVYYTKPPVIIFGLLFPLFMFLAFYLGKEVDFYIFFPGLLAMFLFFIASSVGPLITPWEKQAGTYERLLSFPVSINTIILGDCAAGMIFGIMINLIVLAAGLIFISGIFIPLEDLHGIGRMLSYFSPITYLVDIFNFSIRGLSNISLIVDFAVLFMFSLIFVYLANRLHKRNLMRGL